jgi:hypothetical protein
MAENGDGVDRNEISAELWQCQPTSNSRREINRTASRSFSRVVLEQAAESLIAANVGQAHSKWPPIHCSQPVIGEPTSRTGC